MVTNAEAIGVGDRRALQRNPNDPDPSSPERRIIMTASDSPWSREHLIYWLYEAAELEHNLMCTYLYAAFSLRQGEADGLSPAEAEVVARWRSTILRVAVEEMGHLTAVWNITAALGGAPRFGRGNFPLDPGALPAGVVVKLAPFSEAVLQHFIHLERPDGSTEPDGAGFVPELLFKRGGPTIRLTPMATDYETVGVFYAALGKNLRAFVDRVGEKVAFCGDPGLQLSPAELNLAGAKPVICLKTALGAFTTIIEQGEGAPLLSHGSHYQKFLAIRDELASLKKANPSFAPAFPAAQNPVYRPPLRPEGRVWIENEEAAITVDLANTAYTLMLRLMAHSYSVARPAPEKSLAVDLALGLMRAMTHLAERAVRLPAGPSNPGCNAGMSFAALRDASALPPGPSARRFFVERLEEVATAAAALAANGDKRTMAASRILSELSRRATRDFEDASSVTAAVPAPPQEPKPKVALPIAPTPQTIDGVDHVEGTRLTLLWEGKRCIHARHCVTGAPDVFLANVEGPWIHPDAVSVERLVEIAHVCPSGAIRYRRKDGAPDEAPPPVNLLAVRESGPYAVRGDIRLDGKGGFYRATLCRCGASKNKPFCDGSHHEVGFSASGEPPTGKTDMLAVRNGPLVIDPLMDGPLQVRGNLEITSGTGRCVERVQQARLCRCGASNTKPFCDNSHVRVGFKSD
jgi:CDGSH-type Zn-finger protein/uncharacterized Fe-S cluster protein YjdI